ncbi:Rieske (2Fe-2S) protein [Mycolicibacterium madagascariense]|uniref:Rieske (2Fe-2S) protein n=1 Tax=Mycolicibacterium madagascariense TaxID=212765 RepID=UPI0013CF615A|nr:Rieske (2Fe-2S) protein [Mycolicibacterium madagascariense]MCV7011532.1 Rieske (2Fe-2S) protein [Mycolicibacterium madagascariense]
MPEVTRPPRRTVIVGAGIGAVAVTAAGCGSSAQTPSASSTSAPASTASPSGSVLTKTSDVPVGSGVIVADTVITQPTAGVFKGFSPVCPHRGCNVNAVTDGKIICPCHDSEFDLDGSVVKGPAKAPLAAKPIAVQGTSIVAG